MKIENWAKKFLGKSRLAHLATSSKHGKPHVVPVCYVYDGVSIYTSIDEKPKRTTPKQLRRILNIVENPHVSMIVDQYEEDWSKLRYVLVQGSARIVQVGDEHRRAVSLLREKYPQYCAMKLEDRPIIKIEPVRVVAWNAGHI
jgi:PPOX class probable F420-dependent enzyme